MLTEVGSKWDRASSCCLPAFQDPSRAPFGERLTEIQLQRKNKHSRLRVAELGLELKDNRLRVSTVAAQGTQDPQLWTGSGSYPSAEGSRRMLVVSQSSIPGKLSGGWIIIWALNFSTYDISNKGDNSILEITHLQCYLITTVDSNSEK